MRDVLFQDHAIGRKKLEYEGADLWLPNPELGDILYVNENATAPANRPKWSRNLEGKAYNTIAYAATQATAGDVIVVAAGHTESVSAADAWLWAAAGVTLVGLGCNQRRPVITFDTLTTATVLLDQTDLSIINFKFVCGVDSLALMFNVTAAGCRFQNCQFILDDSSKQALIGINLGDVAADFVRIEDCEFESINAGCNSAVKIAAAVNGLVVQGCKVFGDFADACIHNPAATVATNLLIRDCVLTNTQTGDHSIELLSACTGNLVRNYYNNDMVQATGVDPGSCRSFECYHDDVVDTSGILSPAVT